MINPAKQRPPTARDTEAARVAPAAAAGGCDEHITLADDERQMCEIWTRVMGYHRPVASFNIGKKGEHAERRFFVEAAIASQS
jgi:hypothetical protein